MDRFYNGTKQEPSTTPTIEPTTAPPVTTPNKEKDPSRIPFKRPEVDPRPKA